MLDHRLLTSVKLHEGLRLEAYLDTEGVPTIGYGRNLLKLRITPDTAEKWLREDLEEARREAERFPEFFELDTVARRNVFIEMVFNLGATRLAGFKKMLAAIRDHDWQRAADEMLNSKWARQVGKRADRLAHLMRHGTYT